MSLNSPLSPSTHNEPWTMLQEDDLQAISRVFQAALDRIVVPKLDALQEQLSEIVYHDGSRIIYRTAKHSRSPDRADQHHSTNPQARGGSSGSMVERSFLDMSDSLSSNTLRRRGTVTDHHRHVSVQLTPKDDTASIPRPEVHTPRISVDDLDEKFDHLRFGHRAAKVDSATMHDFDALFRELTRVMEMLKKPRTSDAEIDSVLQAIEEKDRKSQGRDREVLEAIESFRNEILVQSQAINHRLESLLNEERIRKLKCKKKRSRFSLLALKKLLCLSSRRNSSPPDIATSSVLQQVLDGIQHIEDALVCNAHGSTDNVTQAEKQTDYLLQSLRQEARSSASMTRYRRKRSR